MLSFLYIIITASCTGHSGLVLGRSTGVFALDLEFLYPQNMFGGKHLNTGSWITGAEAWFALDADKPCFATVSCHCICAFSVATCSLSNEDFILLLFIFSVCFIIFYVVPAFYLSLLV